MPLVSLQLPNGQTVSLVVSPEYIGQIYEVEHDGHMIPYIVEYDSLCGFTGRRVPSADGTLAAQVMAERQHYMTELWRAEQQRIRELENPYLLWQYPEGGQYVGYTYAGMDPVDGSEVHTMQEAGLSLGPGIRELASRGNVYTYSSSFTEQDLRNIVTGVVDYQRELQQHLDNEELRFSERNNLKARPGDKKPEPQKPEEHEPFMFA